MATPARSTPPPTGSTVTARVATGASIAVMVIAGATLAGWLLDVDFLKSPAPALATMKFNTALSLAVLAAGLLLRARRSGATVATALFVIALALATLAEHLGSPSLGIDELVVDDTGTASSAAPGRMAPATALALLLLGAAQLASARGRTRLAQGLLVLPGLIGVVSILGYAFSVGELYNLAPFATVSFQTALAITLLVLAEAARLESGVTRWVLTDQGLGAAAVRRIGPAIIFGLPLVGFVLARLETEGVLGAQIALALTVVLGMVLVMVALVVTARQLDVVDAGRTAARAELERINASLVEGRDLAWRRAEEVTAELQAERARFDRAVANLEDLLWTVRVHEDRLELVYASPGVTGILGGEPPEGVELEQLLDERVPAQDRDNVTDLLARVTRGERAEARFRVRGFDGVERWLWVRGQPREEAGALFFDGLVADVTTTQRLAEERDALLAAETERVRELQELNRLRDEFLAVAGHELRTPLAAIRGFAELALEGELPSAERDYLRIIMARSRQLGRMVDDLFDLTKLEAGMVELASQRLDLHRLAEETTEAHQAGASSAGVRLSLEGEPTWLVGDGVRLRQVLDNLIGNAIKYTPRGGSVQVTCRPTSDGARLTVADTGMGISADDLPHVFDRLFRSTSARVQSLPGTGLGLAVTKALVDAHHGSIHVTSELGHGTRFDVDLPTAVLERTNAAGKEPPHQRPAAADAVDLRPR